MTRFTSSLTIATLLTLGLHAAPAHAQLSRTFVSAAIGNDANNCDRPTPCRTFQVAHNKTNTDGEITVLYPGGYGGLTITKSISIVNDGVGEASILVAGGGTGITINAPGAGYVNLRGITIQGIGFGGGTGLKFNSGFSLTMTNCVIRNHTSHGILFSPVGISGMLANLSVSNTLVADNGGNGIEVMPFNAYYVRAVLNRVEAYNNSGTGIHVDGSFTSAVTLNVSVQASVSANNGVAGFGAKSASGSALVQVGVVGSLVANNLIFGFNVETAHAQIAVGQSTVMGNFVAANGLARISHTNFARLAILWSDFLCFSMGMPPRGVGRRESRRRFSGS